MKPQIDTETCCVPSEKSAPITPDDESLAALATALGHPARVAIVRFLKNHGACICGEIVGVLPLAQSTVSQHLKVLKSAGWVRGEVDGPRTCYCLEPLALERFRGFLDAL
ncbi:transcriptional regulator, ArsR family [Abditibacterium utsteinense]|uniref:Transcriptional regulator, ArsR family n=1 Tax=Abditibacterium utsteinense TaxID=1960156 RepID=A0A2S8SWL4_9BACT|nr:metalloregulator ArsR/SmtB family transcription factor [Abditibacterium utsteinense]PQV65149.1 transcriptional regulator, ArsR family [Abditibacterium utsteinense]